MARSAAVTPGGVLPGRAVHARHVSRWPARRHSSACLVLPSMRVWRVQGSHWPQIARSAARRLYEADTRRRSLGASPFVDLTRGEGGADRAKCVKTMQVWPFSGLSQLKECTKVLVSYP